MGVRNYLIPFTDGGRHVHHECRECGTNLDSDHESCPDCNGRVAAYEL